MTAKPRLDLWMLVGGVVILDQMDIEVLGRFVIDLLRKRCSQAAVVAFWRTA